MSAPDRTRAPQPGPLPEFRPPPLETLDLGSVRGALVPAPELGYCVLQVGVGAGMRFTPAELAGRAALTADVLAEGTARLDGTELVAELDSLGGSLDVRAGEDEVVLEVTLLARHAARGAALLEELCFEPRFDPADFERARRQRLARLEMRASDPSALAGDAWRAALYGAETPLGAPSSGTTESLARLDAEGLAEAWRIALETRATRVAAVGPLEAHALERSLPRLAGLSPLATDDAGDAGSPRAAEGPSLVTVACPGAPQVQLRLGHLAVPAQDPDFFPLIALNLPLGGALTSRINLNLREERGWTYGARSAFRAGGTTGWFQVSTAVESSVAAEAAAEIRREVEAYRADGLRDDEVEHTRKSLSRTLLLQYEPAGAKAAFATNTAKYGWPADYPARRLEWLDAMGREDLNALAQKHLRPAEFHLVAVGDPKALDAFTS